MLISRPVYSLACITLEVKVKLHDGYVHSACALDMFCVFCVQYAYCINSKSSMLVCHCLCAEFACIISAVCFYYDTLIFY